ncbi:MAG: glycosyltransferase family 4 protein [Deltaproteobacteria bacterium]
MRILMDSRMLYSSGIGRYIRCILSGMARLDEDFSFDLRGDPAEFYRFINEEQVDHRRFDHRTYTPAIYGFREQVEGSLRLQAKHSDIVHIPHFNAPWLMPDSCVVTVHDLIPFKFAERHNPLRVKAGLQVLKNAVEKAARIIVVSDATASDLIQLFPSNRVKAKIRRTYLGVSEMFHPLGRAEIEHFKLQNDLGDYVLYVGNRLPHKNLGRLARAMSILQGDFPGLQLVVAGKRFLENDDLDEARRSGQCGPIIEWGTAGDDELVKLYSGARVLAFPSLLEGFGLPAIEAMACGTPVVVSNIGSLPEVAGSGGICVDPYKVEDIARGIHKVLSDSSLRSRLSEHGLEQASRFRWEDTARQTMQIYHEVLDERPS